MLTCRQAAELASQSLDRRLSPRQRFSLWLHLKACRFCSAFRQQLLWLRRAAAQEALRLEQEARLSADARRRMQEALDRATG